MENLPKSKYRTAEKYPIRKIKAIFPWSAKAVALVNKNKIKVEFYLQAGFACIIIVYST